MKITSRASDYALLLLMHLARLPKEETTSVKKISEKLNLSIRFLANIANKLVIARILLSNRGIGGGIRLGKLSNAITVRDVVEAVDGPVQTMFCQNTHELCSHVGLCEMKHFWDDIQGTVMQKLTDTTLEDLVRARKPLANLNAAGAGLQSV